ncbi:MFS transporter [Paraburkholderia sp. C35]|uniref:MFS transporter n=1 Tax=Paraburkholderia sp. C35 TaxID=2126993 RepID=UPI000D68700B|nr:MFS transporter [Paraburkholderia sp. C35]
MNHSTALPPRAAWTLALMLTGLYTVNFLDKVVLGMVAVPLMADLHLSPAQFGVVAGSFFWLFSISTIVVGFASNRVSARWLLLAMGVSWAVIQVPQALATSAMGILVCRVILGAAEGPAFSTSVHAICKWFPDHKRSLPIAVVSQGAALGLLLAGLLIPLVTRTWGWRMNFFALCGIGFVWSIAWLYMSRDRNPQAAASEAGTTDESRRDSNTPARLPYRTILTDPSILSIFLLGFAAYWMLGQNLTWLPSYLEKGLGFDGIAAGRWFAVVIGVASPLNIGLSWLSERMLARGASTRFARAQLLSMMAMMAGALFVAVAVLDLPPIGKTLLFALAGALPTLCFPLAPALLAEGGPESQRGAIVAIYTAVASLGAAIAPAIMGRIVQNAGPASSHAFENGFLIGAALLFVAALAALRWLHPARSNRMLSARIVPVSA